MKQDNKEPDIKLHELLKKLIELNGSDLHLTTGTPPQVRIDGELRPLDGRADGCLLRGDHGEVGGAALVHPRPAKGAEAAAGPARDPEPVPLGAVRVDWRDRLAFTS